MIPAHMPDQSETGYEKSSINQILLRGLLLLSLWTNANSVMSVKLFFFFIRIREENLHEFP